MRMTVAITILLAWIPFFWQPLRGQSPRVGKDDDQKPKQKTKLATHQPQVGTEVSPLIVETHARAESKEEAAETQRYKKQTLLFNRLTLTFAGAAAVFTGLLVWIGYRGVNAAVRTLTAIERQTKATENNVAVLINSERAWVVISDTRAPDLKISISPGMIAGPLDYNTHT